jgi:hypothetical protein
MADQRGMNNRMASATPSKANKGRWALRIRVLIMMTYKTLTAADMFPEFQRTDGGGRTADDGERTTDDGRRTTDISVIRRLLSGV